MGEEMPRPEKTDRFKVTEREAGAQRFAPELQVDAGAVFEGALPASADTDCVEALLPSDTGEVRGAVSVSDNEQFPVQKTPAVLAREQQLEMRGICTNDEVMPQLEAIRNHPDFIDHMGRIARSEADRLYCKHDMSHLLDVARIAYIRSLERKLPFRKEAVYAAALLHDVGKAEQYEHGEAHEVAGIRIATTILMDVDGFSALEKTAIVAAVAQHRHYDEASSPLGKLLFEADKSSRACFCCSHRDTCNWPEEKMNLGVKI